MKKVLKVTSYAHDECTLKFKCLHVIWLYDDQVGCHHLFQTSLPVIASLLRESSPDVDE